MIYRPRRREARVTHLLKKVFHSDAWMFGAVGGERYDIPISQLIEIVTSQPFDSGGSYQARITSVQQVGDAATAIVEEDGIWGSLSCVDFFTLVKMTAPGRSSTRRSPTPPARCRPDDPMRQ
jgi:hypothetical protein